MISHALFENPDRWGTTHLAPAKPVHSYDSFAVFGVLLSCLTLSGCVGLTIANPPGSNANSTKTHLGTLAVGATSLHFGNVATGSSSTQTLALSNQGTTTVNVSLG